MISIEEMKKAEFKKNVTIYFTDGRVWENQYTQDFIEEDYYKDDEIEEYEEAMLLVGEDWAITQSRIERIEIIE